MILFFMALFLFMVSLWCFYLATKRWVLTIQKERILQNYVVNVIQLMRQIDARNIVDVLLNHYKEMLHAGSTKKRNPKG